MKSIHYGMALSFLASIACSSGDQTTTDGGSDSSSGSDSATGSDTGTSSKPNVGFVTFSQTKTGTTDTFSAAAAFLALGDAGTIGPACSGMQSGSCCYTPPSSGSDAGTTSTGTAIGAGAVTIKDGTTTLATMTPSGTSYTPVSNPPTSALTWNSGDSLAVSAAGDAVHAFNGAVTAVGTLLGVSPALSFTTPVVVSRAADFNVTWTSATGRIQLTLVALKGTSADGSITCSSTTDTGTMSVPSALLQKFSAADTGIISLSRTISSDASPDNATVTLSSSTSTSGTATFN